MRCVEEEDVLWSLLASEIHLFYNISWSIVIGEGQAERPEFPRTDERLCMVPLKSVERMVSIKKLRISQTTLCY